MFASVVRVRMCTSSSGKGPSAGVVVEVAAVEKDAEKADVSVRGEAVVGVDEVKELLAERGGVCARVL